MKQTFLLPLLATFAMTDAQSAELLVHINHIKADHGSIRIALYRQETNYLSDDDAKAFRLATATAQIPGVSATIPDLPAGRYTIKVFHDEDDNGKLKRNFFGAPAEPYGISNNVRASFSLPPFNEALIDVTEPRSETLIKIDHH